jgi:acetylornithine aminotransferase
MTEGLDTIQAREKSLLFTTYNRYPLHIRKASGTKLYDAEGREYTDLLAGISVCNLGHCPLELAETICDQAKRLVHVSNLFYQEEQLELAERLLATCSLERVFFCNSGAEANEAAIKMARRYMQKVRGRQAFEVLSLQNSFHGRTLGTLAATGQEKIKEGFHPLPEGFRTVQATTVEDMEQAISDQTAGVLLEVVQGEGGVQPLSETYLRDLRELCRQRDILFMVDEIQTGMGRSGKMWAHQHLDLQPDVFTVAKALANGLPIGAMIASEEVGAAFGPGAHGTTFGGGALVSGAASAVLRIMERDGLCGRAAEMGAVAQDRLRQVQSRHPEAVSAVRGLGLMLGVELSYPAQPVWERLLQQGYVCNVTQERVLRLLPPLIISREEIEGFASALETALHQEAQAPEG